MPTMDIFNNNAFSMRTLTASVNEMDVAPSMLGDEGLFEERGITTTTIQVEKKGQSLALVSAGERGAPGQSGQKARRDMVPFNLVHLPQADSILADTIQGTRAFGSETELETVQSQVNEKIGDLKANNDATLEWQRIGALKGKILDADGTTILENINSRFGITQPTQNMALSVDATKVRSLIVDTTRAIKKSLGAVTIREFRCKCSPSFFDLLIEHAEVKAAYDRWMEGEALRNNMDAGFVYGGVRFQVYDASVADKDFIDAGDAYLYPVGVPGMFITRFGPADYMDTVNTVGLPYYASLERMPHNKGVDIEVQSTTITLNTRPKGVFRLFTA